MSGQVTPDALVRSPRIQNRPPFLYWPVGLHEFYFSIAIGLLPTLAWGLVIFGWRALMQISAAFCGAVACHGVLARFTRRGRFLVYGHTVASALFIAALCHALWPWPVVAVAGAGTVVLIWVFKGPGNERFHPALLAAFLLTLSLSWLSAPNILVADRLVTGDLADVASTSYYHWPRSYQVDGEEAVRVPLPAETMTRVYSVVARYLSTGVMAHQKLDEIMAQDLPAMSTLLPGVYPGPIGVVGTLAIVAGGLYLAYRNVLRMQSILIFLLAVVVGLLVAPLNSQSLLTLSWRSLAGIWALRPTDVLTYLSYEIFSSDVPFATIFVLAMPGTMPLTRPGRRWFLMTAGILAAFVHRLFLPTPVATWILLAMQPLAPVFDRYLGRRSWLDR